MFLSNLIHTVPGRETLHQTHMSRLRRLPAKLGSFNVCLVGPNMEFSHAPLLSHIFLV